MKNRREYWLMPITLFIALAGASLAGIRVHPAFDWGRYYRESGPTL